MRAAVYYGEHDIRVEDIPDPVCGDSDIVIKMAACGVCGTDVHAYDHGFSMFTAPGRVMGHEFSGQVEVVGSRVVGIQKGDRVTAWPIVHCDRCPRCAEGNWHLCEDAGTSVGSDDTPGAFAEYVRIPNARLNRTVYHVPDGVSWAAAAMVEPLSVGINAVGVAAPGPLDTVVVMGLGTLGLGAVQALRIAGVQKIIGVDRVPRRLEQGQALGADVVIDASSENTVERIRDLAGTGPTGTPQVAAVIECTGAETPLTQAIEVLRGAGRLVLVGLYGKPPTVDLNLVMLKQLSLLGRFAYRTEYATTLGLLASGRLKADPLVSHRFALEQTADAFAAQADRDGSVKVMVVGDGV